MNETTGLGTRRLCELGLTLVERRRVHDIGPLDTLDVSVAIAAGTAGFSLRTDRGVNWGAVRAPANATLPQDIFDELSAELGPYSTRQEASEATLMRLLALFALVC